MITSKLEFYSIYRIDINVKYNRNSQVYVQDSDKKIGSIRIDGPVEDPVVRQLGNWIVEAKGENIFLSLANTDRETESIELIGFQNAVAVVYYSSEDGKEKKDDILYIDLQLSA